MTDKHIPASKLLALQTKELSTGIDIFGNENYAEFIAKSDLRALIDEAPEVEPVGAICDVTKSGLSYAAFTKTLPIGTMLYASAPPSHNLTKLVGELGQALEDVGEWINTLPAGTKAATTKGKMIDTLLTRAKEYLK